MKRNFNVILRHKSGVVFAFHSRGTLVVYIFLLLIIFLLSVYKIMPQEYASLSSFAILTAVVIATTYSIGALWRLSAGVVYWKMSLKRKIEKYNKRIEYLENIQDCEKLEDEKNSLLEMMKKYQERYCSKLTFLEKNIISDNIQE